MTTVATDIPISAHQVEQRRPRLERATFSTSRLLDFSSEKELVAQTGHEVRLWPLVILKELVDNALDACEEAGIAPEIEVDVDDTGILIRDNATGMPASTIEKVLDFSIRVSSREAYVAPDRGAQGNALKTLIAMPFVLNGERGTIEVTAQDIRHRIIFAFDQIQQTPVINHETEPADRKVGTEIRVEWPDSASSILDDAQDRFLQMVDDYTWLNPHLSISGSWLGTDWSTPATNVDWMKWAPSDPTSPHWYTPEHLNRLLAAYLSHDGDRTVRDVISEFRGLTGSAKQKVVLDKTGLARTPLSALVKDGAIDTEIIECLLTAMQETTKPVKPAGLGIIGKDHFEQRFRSAGAEMDSFNYRKVTDTTDGVPWVVETAFGWCPEKDDERRIVTGVNWSPGILNPFRALGHFGDSLDTILAQQRAGRNEPIILVLHMACPLVEYTDRGKSAVVVSS